jgi:hypothetical protein
MPLTDLRSGRDHKVRRLPAGRSEGPVNGRAVLYNRFFQEVRDLLDFSIDYIFQEVITEICLWSKATTRYPTHFSLSMPTWN